MSFFFLLDLITLILKATFQSFIMSGKDNFKQVVKHYNNLNEIESKITASNDLRVLTRV